jgi:hypothetical protein
MSRRNPKQIRRASPIPLNVEREDGTSEVVSIPPLTLGRYRDLIALDPTSAEAEAETPEQFALRMAKQLMAALPERLHAWAQGLHLYQARLILGALITEYAGDDPAAAVALQRELARLTPDQRDQRQQDMMDGVDELTVRLAGRLGSTPETVDGMAVTDAVSLQTVLLEQHAENLRLYGHQQLN